MRRIALLLFMLLIAVAPTRAEEAAAKKTGFITVASSGQEFDLSGRTWRAFGCNYFDPHVGWAPKLWQKFDAARVEDHFKIMRELGVGVVRVFLTAQSFFPDGEALDPEALKKFDAMLEIGRRNDIRVHPTGPDHWEGTPEWRRGDIYTDPKALEAQVKFWKLFAARYRDEPMIFAYDLLNEPHVRWTSPGMAKRWPAHVADEYKTTDALHKAWGAEASGIESFGAVAIPPDQAAPGSRQLLDYQRFRESIADRWVRLQVDAIRAADPNHLVTVGLIQWSVPVLHGRPSQYAAFRPSRIAPMVDFQSVHFYPLHGNPSASKEDFDRNLAYLEFVLRCAKAGDPKKPLVVGEFGWNGGNEPNRTAEEKAADQREWCRGAVLQGAGIAAAWLNWAYADTPSARDLTNFSGLVTEDGKVKPWGREFQAYSEKPSVWAEAQGNAPAAEVEFEIDRAIVDPKAADEMLKRYVELWKAARGRR